VRRYGGSLAALLLVLGGGPASAGGDGGLKEALDRLQARYEATRTLTAAFVQTLESPALAGALESRGRVSFEKPNRMRWDYEAPDRQVIVGDGETLWIYQPDDRQVIKAPLGDAFQATTPVTFLAGLGHVERDFTATLEDEAGDRWVLRLLPRTDRGIGTLVLVVRKADATVEEARVTDALGTTTRLRLSEERRNVALDPALFRFVPPPGVDVVRPPAY
jgi:outer membrane lipoprotein carrier protein